ncbi:hypothetical protein ACHIPZ_13785 [Antrihabitans sp. NCIMB 15449]|uniref:Uncharacterized protein n=1 Tax=Antrihabitans spumae TaxID=3373370 RepID=A0ABW7JNN6_9NOCA
MSESITDLQPQSATSLPAHTSQKAVTVTLADVAVYALVALVYDALGKNAPPITTILTDRPSA